MTLITKAIWASLIALSGLFAVNVPNVAKQPQTPIQAAATSVTMPQVASKPTPLPSSTPPIQAGNCHAFIGLAYGIGWPAAALDTLELAMRLESGCDPYAVGDNGNSIGLMQIHMPTWCTPNDNWPVGWMQHYNLGICGDLFNPKTNLLVALAIWEGWTGSTPGWQHWHALK
jgi:hypothetical protein